MIRDNISIQIYVKIIIELKILFINTKVILKEKFIKFVNIILSIKKNYYFILNLKFQTLSLKNSIKF